VYRDHGNRCPACDAPLADLKATLPIEGCAACGGVWLGPDAAVHVLRGLGDRLEHEIATASAGVAARAAVRPSDAGTRACPTCAQVMGRLEVARTVVDSCPAHGTWFDRQEIASVIAVCGALRRAQSEEMGSPEEAAYRAVQGEARARGYVHSGPSAPISSVFLDTIVEVLGRFVGK
jgi:Zn-finger nucleic acid-binding protein